MYKYVLIAALAALLVYLGTFFEKKIAEKSGLSRSKAYKQIVMVASYVLAALLFCVVAGMRSQSVGSDVEVYVIPSFEEASSESFAEYFFSGRYSGWMPFSKIVFWMVPNLTLNMFGMLFIVQAIIVIPLFVAVRLILKDRAWLAILIFGLAFFPISLNNMRQFMGMGFIVLSYIFVRKRRFLLFMLFIAISVLFHETCILGLLIYPLWLISSKELKKLHIRPAIVAVGALALIQVFFPALNLVAPYIGRFGLYINGEILASQTYNGITELRFIVFLCAVLGFAYCWFTRKGAEDLVIKGEASGLAAIVFFGVAMFSMCLYSYQLFRMGMFFLYFAVLLIPIAAERIPDRCNRRDFIILSGCFIALFGLMYFGAGAHEVIPYTIDLENIL